MTRTDRYTLPRILAALMLVGAATCPGTSAAEIAASPALPKTSPWDLKALSKAPAFEWVDAKGAVRSLLYTGEAYGGKPTRVFAYYANPLTLREAVNESPKNLAPRQEVPAPPYPAVVLIHGGGGTAFREWAERWAKRGYAAIAMDLGGARPIEGKNPHRRENRTRLDDGGPGQGDAEKFGSIDKPVTEQWPYHAVANVIKAHSLVRSFKEVDANRTAVTGISWGGYLTCIVAGVDSRFKAAVPVYGCGFLHENSVWLKRFKAMHPMQRGRWVTLWDPSRYLPAVSMPTLFVNGTNDFAYPLDSYMKSYDAVATAKLPDSGKKTEDLTQLSVTVNMPHSHPAGWKPVTIELFIDQHLREGKPIPMLAGVSIKDGQVHGSARSRTRLTRTAIHFTTDSTAINKRKWVSKPGVIGPSTKSTTTLQWPAPPKDATAWFVTVTDERGAVVSGRVEVR